MAVEYGPAWPENAALPAAKHGYLHLEQQPVIFCPSVCCSVLSWVFVAFWRHF
jgi:hypothetical protein